MSHPLASPSPPNSAPLSASESSLPKPSDRAEPSVDQYGNILSSQIIKRTPSGQARRKKHFRKKSANELPAFTSTSSPRKLPRSTRKPRRPSSPSSSSPYNMYQEVSSNGSSNYEAVSYLQSDGSSHNSDSDDERLGWHNGTTSNNNGKLSSSQDSNPDVESDWEGRDWNSRFQRICEAIRSESVLDAESRSYQSLNEELVHLSDDFIQAANTYGRIIISERYLAKKTIPPDPSYGGAAGGEKYVVNQILFKFAVDFKGLYGGDHGAAKAAGQELKGLIAYYRYDDAFSIQLEFPQFFEIYFTFFFPLQNSCGVPQLLVPLMALVDYMGFRMIAISILPVTPSTLVYGSADAGITVHDDNSEFSKCMLQAAKRLNLAPHYCGAPGAQRRLSAACDVEGHVGTDGKFYLLDFSRTFPPTMPNRKIVNSHLFQLFRSEFVAAYEIPLCPDAYSGFIRADESRGIYNAQIQEATWLLTRQLPAYMLKNGVAETIISAYSSSSNSEILNLSVPFLMHMWGMNVRLIGLLIAESQYYPTEVTLALLIEAVARALKSHLRARMRAKMCELKVPLLAPYRQLIVDFFNQVFRPVEDSLEFWADEILPILSSFFAINDFRIICPDKQSASRPIQPPDDLFPTLPEGRKPHSSVLFSQTGILGISAENTASISASKALNPVTLTLSDIMAWDTPLGSTSIRPRWVLFLRLCTLLDLTFSPHLENKIYRSAYSDMRNGLFDTRDLVSIDVGVKHPTVVTNSAGMFWFGRGSTLLRTDNASPADIKSCFLQAKEKFQTALRSDPANKEALINLASTSLKLLELEGKGAMAMATVDFSLSSPAVREVQQYYVRAIKGDPRDPLTYYLYAKFLRRCGEYPSAEECYIHAAQNDPNCVRILQGYGLFLMERDDPDGEALLRRASYCSQLEALKETGQL
ncbi:MAG: hypothetical protein Q8P67_17575 [archaeon]|nr:hypothetical protein [archaeon]